MATKKHNNGLESLDLADPKMWETPEPLEFTPPRWMFESYLGDEKDMAHDIYSATFWKKLKDDIDDAKARGVEPPNMNEVALRASEIAKTIMAAAEHTSDVSETAKRAFFTLVYKVKKNNLQHLALAEYDTIEEWLTDRVENMSPSAGELGDITFMMSEVFPMLERVGHGFEPEKLLSIKENWSKARASVPYLRMITNRHRDAIQPIEKQINFTASRISVLVANNRDRSPDHPKFKKTVVRIEELRTGLKGLEKEHEKVLVEETAKWEKGVEKTLNVIANPDIKPWGKEGELTVKAALFKDEQRTLTMYEGFQGVLPGRSIFVLILPSRYERTVESSLSGLVEWKLLDPAIMKNEIDKALKNNPFVNEKADEDLA